MSKNDFDAVFRQRENSNPLFAWTQKGRESVEEKLSEKEMLDLVAHVLYVYEMETYTAARVNVVFPVYTCCIPEHLAKRFPDDHVVWFLMGDQGSACIMAGVHESVCIDAEFFVGLTEAFLRTFFKSLLNIL